MGNKIFIAADSSCDLSKELIEQYDIKVLPMHVNFEDEEYLDGATISLKEMFAKVSEKGVLPKTAACSPAEFIKFFGEMLKEDPDADIIYIGISSNFSSTYQGAVLAAEAMENDRIHLIDGQNLSTGTGLLLLKACSFRNRGLSAKQIVDRIHKIIPRVKTQFVLDSLEYLKKGGRCKSITFVIGTMLRIHPMIVVRNAKMVVGRKVIGSMKKACLDMMKLFKNDVSKIDPEFVFITHCAGEANIEYLKEEVDKANFVKNLCITEAGCTVGSHCGPGCIGVLYILKNEEVTLEYDVEED